MLTTDRLWLRPWKGRVKTFTHFSVNNSLADIASPLFAGFIVTVYSHNYMAALWNRAGHYILPCGFFDLSFFFFFFSLA